MKKRTKKYHPREIRLHPKLWDVMAPKLTDNDVEAIYECAARALDFCQLGTTAVEPYGSVRSAIRECFVLAGAYENKYDLKMLCALADAGVLLAWAAVAGKTVKGKGKFVDEHSPEFRAAALAPAQAVIDALSDMHRASPRSELVRAQRAALGKRVLDFIEEAGVIQDDGARKKPGGLPYGTRGLAWVHGACRSGYLDWDGRLVWRMPQTDSQVPLKEPTLIFMVPNGINYCGEKLNAEAKTDMGSGRSQIQAPL